MAKGILRKAAEILGVFGPEKRDYELETWRAFQAKQDYDLLVEKRTREIDNALKKRNANAPLPIDELTKVILNNSQWGRVNIPDHIKEGLSDDGGDHRYKVPKEEPKASDEDVKATIERNEIYQRAQRAILSAQHKQVAYGLDKYPEPLNADTWSHLETIDHIIDESIDKLHYLMMLRIKLERDADESIENMRTAYETAGYSVQTTQDPERFRASALCGGDYDGDTCTQLETVTENGVTHVQFAPGMPSLASVNVPLNFDTTELQKAIKDFNKKMSEGQVMKP